MSDQPNTTPEPLTNAELQAAAHAAVPEGVVFTPALLRQRLREVAAIIARLPDQPVGPSLIVITAEASAVPLVRTLESDVCVVGRGSDCDLILEGDAKLSRHHFQITRRAGEFHLDNLESSNGTYLSGHEARVEHHVLSDGDLIHAGHHRFLFWLGADPAE